METKSSRRLIKAYSENGQRCRERLLANIAERKHEGSGLDMSPVLMSVFVFLAFILIAVVIVVATGILFQDPGLAFIAMAVAGIGGLFFVIVVVVLPVSRGGE